MLNFLITNARWLSAGMLLTFASCFGQTFFISVFADDIMTHYKLSNGEWGRAYATGTLISGFLMIFVGGMTDRFRARSLAVFFLCAISASCLVMSLNTSVLLLPFIIFLLRFCGQGMLFHISVVAMSRWFSQNRGKALSLANLGFSVGEASLPIIAVILMGYFGWQSLWQFAAIAALLFIPILLKLLALERTPQSVSHDQPNSRGLENRHWTRSDVLRHWLFWMIMPSAMAPSIFGTALFFQQIHLADAKGWGHTSFVALFPMYTLASIFAMMIWGQLTDRFSAKKFLPFYQLPMVLAYCVIAWGGGFGFAIIGLLLMAVMQGGSSTILAAMWSELYGTKHIGTIKAMATAIMVFGSAIGPMITGYYIDLGISFPEQMPYYAAAVLIFCAMSYIATRRIMAASA